MKVLAGNWKLNKTPNDVADFFEQLKLPASDNYQAIIAASPTLLSKALECAGNVKIFAQDIAEKESGALTGETSASQLRALGVSGTLVAHSERRQFFAETNERANAKIKLALAAELNVIYCIGEHLSERESNQTEQVLEEQLSIGLADISSPSNVTLDIAYEPVWAIGTGKTANNEQIRETHAFIRTWLNEHNFSNARILYGGSVKPSNFEEISAIENVDGGLVGGASLDPANFATLANSVL